MKNIFTLLVVLLVSYDTMQAQPCTPQGDETTSGTSDIWIGYVYDNVDFTGYVGYANEGTTGNPSFDESFGGNNTNYATNGCPANTETFSVRYKLNKTFTNGNYEFTVGGDDGYRLSLDGGSTWAISNWGDHGYATSSTILTLNGPYDLVLEFYENGGDNRITFNIATACFATGDQTISGTGNIWNAYVYDGTAFNTYVGRITAGSAFDANFNENFGGDNVTLNTNECSTVTETFSVRYRLTKAFASGIYLITVGGDDGYRLSLDGGNTWAIDRWFDQSYASTSYSATLSGNVDMVLEYYENGGGNHVSFTMSMTSLPVSFINFTAQKKDQAVKLGWQTATESNNDHFVIQRSVDGNEFVNINRVNTKAPGGNSTDILSYEYTDTKPVTGNSFYRVLQVDKDGKSSFSKVIPITINIIQKLNVFPNPVTSGRVYVQTPSGKKINNISMYNVAGKMVYNKKIESPATGAAISIEPSNKIPSGYYTLVLNDGTEQVTVPVWWIQ